MTEHEQLRAELEQTKNRLRYWKGVVRGARAELHQAGRLSNAEYADLCQDSDVRDYVDQLDNIRHAFTELAKAANTLVPQLPAAGTEARTQFNLALDNANRLINALKLD